jgi:hypothetical protein
MAILDRIKLLMLEQKLYHGAFGKYNRYCCWCLKRNAKTTAEKLDIAREVLASRGVTTMEAQYNELFVRRHFSTEPEGEVPDEPAPAEPKPKDNPRLAGTFRILFQKMMLRAGKSGASTAKKAAHKEPVG